MNSKLVLEKIKNSIAEFETVGEAGAIAFLILEDQFQISRMDVLLEKEIETSISIDKKIDSILSELKSGKPIQHILGKVEFYGRQFLVNPNVLIPRRETEELVHLILENNPDLSEQLIVDIGTGSGIIPITIAKERKHCEVYAVDISSSALATAKRNALLNHAKVSFIQADILIEDLDLPKSNIWISNPPYVLEKEKAEMQTKVFEHEPANALFVPNHDALKFYERITQLASQHLIKGGELYFEINEQFGREVKKLMEEKGFRDVKIMGDMQGKDRFVFGRR
ncbi:peptide chain release factor N(5)-glutamine methyltransferase [Marivirga salinae]|uniref:peptide chain release factor N(5)-glutamine methyltransferase n=1 Tax=Marivirga salinarum TaxID=3059078 RepID=A0AA49GAQ3_9BACT|nr:peptide chain release factor N(5)-glutamine methyltransferase [Marivirga sp. BDSF4-3]WKK75666.2 peptide chain release factor N(5)-glutamine methyltransferase [Marivirga sp. BDSF4-3]